MEVNNTLFDLNIGYEEFKRATGRRDFFKARHHYTMLDILEEWELFDAVLGETAAFFADQAARRRSEVNFAYAPKEVQFLPPILYPDKVLNAGSNFSITRSKWVPPRRSPTSRNRTSSTRVRGIR